MSDGASPLTRKKTTEDLHFPKAGIDIAQAFGRQPARPVYGDEYARTTRQAINVRCFDSGGRTRGASRNGIRKYIAQQVPMDEEEFIIQHLNTIVTAGAAAVQYSQLGRIVSTVVVVEGQVYRLLPGATAFESVTNNTGEDPPLAYSGLIRSASNSQKMWFADGENWVYYNPADNTLNTWGATAGALPIDADGNLPSLIANWRGRILLAGLELEPQNVHMSKVGDPTNWDYFPTSPSSIDAVAGNNPGSFGLIGDVVNTIIPYNDDNCIFGCDSTVYILRGDPLAGGQVDLVTRAMGMAFGEPWCMGPDGTVYFFSNRCGIFAMSPSQSGPQRISSPIDSEIQGINTGTNGVCMAWDDTYQGIYVFISPLAEPGPGSNWYWDMRNQAWVRDRFKNPKHNPLVVAAFDGNEPEDRALLIGSWDGYVRTFSPDAEDDDGWPIESEVWIGPVMTRDLDDVTLHAIQAVLGENSGAVTWGIYPGNTAEAAFNSQPQETGVWDPSRNLTDNIKVADHAIYIKLTSTVPWSMEAIRVTTSINGKLRARGR